MNEKQLTCHVLLHLLSDYVEGDLPDDLCKQLEVIDFQVKHGVRCFPINSGKRKKLVELFYEKEVENPNGLVRKTYLDCEPVDGRQSAVTALRTCV